MIMRHLPTFLFAIGFTLLLAAAGAYLFLRDAPGAFVDEPDRAGLALTVGKNEMRFRLHNPTSHAVRVVGSQYC